MQNVGGNVCGGVNDKIMHANLCLLLAVIFWQYIVQARYQHIAQYISMYFLF